MTPRAYWKGYLRLSLVTCPIELFPATSQSEKTHFHQINTKTGHRLRQQMVDEVELAEHILETKAGHFDPKRFKDDYELALRKLVKRKAAGEKIEAPPPAEAP